MHEVWRSPASGPSVNPSLPFPPPSMKAFFCTWNNLSHVSSSPREQTLPWDRVTCICFHTQCLHCIVRADDIHLLYEETQRGQCWRQWNLLSTSSASIPLCFLPLIIHYHSLSNLGRKEVCLDVWVGSAKAKGLIWDDPPAYRISRWYRAGDRVDSYGCLLAFLHLPVKVHTYNFSIQRAEAGGLLWVGNQPR